MKTASLYLHLFLDTVSAKGLLNNHKVLIKEIEKTLELKASPLITVISYTSNYSEQELSNLLAMLNNYKNDFSWQGKSLEIKNGCVPPIEVLFKDCLNNILNPAVNDLRFRTRDDETIAIILKNDLMDEVHIPLFYSIRGEFAVDRWCVTLLNDMWLKKKKFTTSIDDLLDPKIAKKSLELATKIIEPMQYLRNNHNIFYKKLQNDAEFINVTLSSQNKIKDFIQAIKGEL